MHVKKKYMVIAYPADFKKQPDSDFEKDIIPAGTANETNAFLD